MSKFSFYPSSSNSSRASSPDLPFPEPLPRSDFFAPDFDPSTYLSSLGHRHQTLEDLRADLRSRSQLLNQELLDLVNSHYEEFLGLGGSVKGGEGKVEEVKLGLMGFKREVEGVREKIVTREKEVERLLAQRRKTRKEIATGRRLVEWQERLESLESRLMLGDGQQPNMRKTSDEGDSSDDSSVYSNLSAANEDDGDQGVALARIRRRVKEFKAIDTLTLKLDTNHPLIVAQRPRILKIRSTLLLDVRTAFKQLSEVDAGYRERTLSILRMYRDLDASSEAVNALKGMHT